MRIQTCDICCESIRNPSVDVSVKGDDYLSFDLCEICATPIIRYLRDVKLISGPIVEPVEKFAKTG